MSWSIRRSMGSGPGGTTAPADGTGTRDRLLPLLAVVFYLALAIFYDIDPVWLIATPQPARSQSRDSLYRAQDPPHYRKPTGSSAPDD